MSYEVIKLPMLVQLFNLCIFGILPFYSTIVYLRQIISWSKQIHFHFYILYVNF